MAVKPARPNDAPGYKCKANRDGTWREYWSASDELRRSGFKPTNMRLHYPDTSAGREQLTPRCAQLQGQALAWRAADARSPDGTYTGTVASLAAQFQVDPDSPFHDMRRKGELAVNISRRS